MHISDELYTTGHDNIPRPRNIYKVAAPTGRYSYVVPFAVKFVLAAIVLLLLLVLTGPSFAVNTPQLNLSGLPGGGPPCYARGITVPPPQFDHPARNEQIVRTSCNVVRMICKTEAAACAILPGNGFKTCQIIIPEEMGNSGWEFELTLRHERGHCNSNSTGHAGYVLPPGF